MNNPAPEYKFTFMRLRKGAKYSLGCLAVLTIIAFVFWGAASRLGRDSDEKGEVVAQLDGLDVTRTELAEATLNARIHLQLVMGARPDEDSEIFKTLPDQAWRRLASLRWAEKLGITTGDNEVDEMIGIEFTDKNGVFNEQAFAYFIRTTLGRLGISYADFKAYYREHITLMKLQKAIAAGVWITPVELSRETAKFVDSFVINYAEIPPWKLAGKLDTTEEELKAYYEENTNSFRVPDMMSVEYVAFPFSNYVASVNVTDKQAQDYYDENDEAYTTTNATNALSEPIPFADVKDGIVATLKQQEAAGLAEKEAMAFVMKVAPDRSGNAQPFTAVATAAGLPIRRTPLFAITDEIPGLDLPPDVSREAFELVQDDPERYFSNPVTGSNAVYVMAFAARVESHVPPYADVTNTLRRLVSEKKRREQVKTGAGDLASELKKSVRSGKTLAEAAQARDLQFTTTEPFTWFTAPTNLPAADDLLKNVAAAFPGEFIEPVIDSNTVVVAYVESRTPGDASMNRDFQKYVGDSLRQRRTAMLFQDWQNRIQVPKIEEQEPVVAPEPEKQGPDAAMPFPTDGD